LIRRNFDENSGIKEFSDVFLTNCLNEHTSNSRNFYSNNAFIQLNFNGVTINTSPMHHSPVPISEHFYFCSGEMAERSIAVVLKTIEGNTSGGSNPSLSAAQKPLRIAQGLFVYTLAKLA